MKTYRFGFYAGILWTTVSLVLVAASVLIGYRFAWVELDYRILTGAVLLAAKALGQGDALSGLAFYAETGLPETPVHIILCAALSFVDGFTSGILIAIIYNALAGRMSGTIQGKSVTFGIAAGITLGIASGLLALTCAAYGVGIQSFDFTIRPVWMTFYVWSKLGIPDFLIPFRDSYIYFPRSSAGALGWAVWGFIDGLIEGTVIAYLYMRIRDSV